MHDDRWKRIRELFDEAVALPAIERKPFLEEACDDDAELLSEIDALVESYDDADEFLELPPLARADPFRSTGRGRIEDGTVLSHYRVIRLIGSGGMGEVYLAEDTKLDRQVAIKVLSEEFARYESNLRRFTREAKSASALNHPNILTVHEVGEFEGIHYIVTEYVKGKTLREVLQASPIELGDILNIGVQIADALSAAHEAHLVHRDVKPENVVVRPDGFVKVLDFGLAKLVEGREVSVGEIDLAALVEKDVARNDTADGIILGTTNYMAPERARGQGADSRADIWSLGIVLFEMLTGRTPFGRDTVAETIAAILDDRPAPLSSGPPNSGRGLEEIIDKALRKDREERYTNVKDFLNDLRDLKQQLERGNSKPHVPADKKTSFTLVANTVGDDIPRSAVGDGLTGQLRSRRRTVVLLAIPTLVICLMAGLLTGYFVLNSYRDIPIQDQNSEVTSQMPQATRLTTSGRIRSAQISPDGKFIIYAQIEKDDKLSLWKYHLDSESSVQITAAAADTYFDLTISPDGRHIYFIDVTDGSLHRVDVLAGHRKKIADDLMTRTRSHISVAPDGSRIAFVRESDGAKTLVLADADGGNEGELFSDPHLLQMSSWSPDGKVIACGVLSDSRKFNALAIDVQSGGAVSVQRDWDIIRRISWMPNSRDLIMNALSDTSAINDSTSDRPLEQIWLVSYKNTGDPRLLFENAGNFTSLSATSDGRYLAAVRTEPFGHIWRLAVDDPSHAQQLTAGFEKLDGGETLQLLADGRIVFDSPVGQQDTGTWLMEADGRNSERLLREGVLETMSPDGQFLVYRKTNLGPLWLSDLKSGNEKQLTANQSAFAVFSPDGKEVIYNQDVYLWTVSVDGKSARQILRGGMFPAVSPDGSRVAFLKVPGYNVAIASIDSGITTRVFDVQSEDQGRYARESVEWTPDGKFISYIARVGGVPNIWKVPVNGGDAIQVTTFQSGRLFNFAYSADGKSIVLSRGDVESDVVLIKNLE